MVCSGGASANSFSDLATPNRSQKPSAQTKNTDCPNEFVGLENFEVEGAAGIKSRHAIRPANPPAVGITLETNISYHGCDSHQRGGHSRAPSFPSRPSTLIHPNSKLAPRALIHPATIPQARMLTIQHRKRVPTNPFVCDWPTVGGDNRPLKQRTESS